MTRWTIASEAASIFKTLRRCRSGRHGSRVPPTGGLLSPTAGSAIVRSARAPRRPSGRGSNRERKLAASCIHSSCRACRSRLRSRWRWLVRPRRSGTSSCIRSTAGASGVRSTTSRRPAARSSPPIRRSTSSSPSRATRLRGGARPEPRRRRRRLRRQRRRHGLRLGLGLGRGGLPSSPVLDARHLLAAAVVRAADQGAGGARDHGREPEGARRRDRHRRRREPHPDLNGNVDASRSVSCVGGAPNQDPAAWNDDSGHGTNVAGVIAAEANGYGHRRHRAERQARRHQGEHPQRRERHLPRRRGHLLLRVGRRARRRRGQQQLLGGQRALRRDDLVLPHDPRSARSSRP